MQITTLLQEEDPKTDPETEMVKMAIKPITMKGIQVMTRDIDQEVEEEKQATEEGQMREETHKNPMNQDPEAQALTNQDQKAEITEETQATTEIVQTAEEDTTMIKDQLKGERPKIIMAQELKTRVLRDKLETDHLVMGEDQIAKPEAEIMIEEVITPNQ